MADELKKFMVTKGNFVTDNDGQKGEGEIVSLTAQQATTLLDVKVIEEVKVK